MFDSCITIILGELNNYLKSKYKTFFKHDPITFASINNFDENKKDTKSKLHLFLVDIMHEDLGNSYKEYLQQGNSYVVRNKPVYFSLYILIAVNGLVNKNLESLALLAHVAAFFQSKNYFDNNNTSSLQKIGVDHFTAELVKLNYQERQAFWNILGIAYLPSLLYKIGNIAIADKDNFDTVPVLKETSFSLLSN